MLRQTGWRIELRQSRQDGAGAELRDLIALAYIQANQKNYGLAAETSSQFFNRAREVASQTQDASRRKALEDLLASRDKVTAQLAKGDAAVMGDLLELFNKTRQATRGAGASAVSVYSPPALRELIEETWPANQPCERPEAGDEAASTRPAAWRLRDCGSGIPGKGHRDVTPAPSTTAGWSDRYFRRGSPDEEDCCCTSLHCLR